MLTATELADRLDDIYHKGRESLREEKSHKELLADLREIVAMADLGEVAEIAHEPETVDGQFVGGEGGGA